MARLAALGVGPARVDLLIAEPARDGIRVVAVHGRARAPDAPPAEAIRALLREAGGAVDICAPLPAAEGFLRRLQIPFRKPAEVQSVLAFQVEPLLPVPLERVVLADATVAVGDAGSTLLVGAVPADRLRGHLESLREAGVDPVSVPLDVSLVAAAARDACPAARQGVWAVLVLDPAAPGIAVLEGGILATARALACPADPAWLQDPVRLGAEVSRTLASASLSQTADGVLLAGEGATEGCRERLASLAGAVEIWAPKGHGAAVPPGAALLYGALLQMASPQPDVLELRRGEFAYARRIERLAPSMVAAMVSVAALGMIWGAHLHLRTVENDARTAAVRDWHRQAWDGHFAPEEPPGGDALLAFRGKGAEFAEARPLGPGQAIRSTLQMWRELHESLATAGAAFRVKEVRLRGTPDAHLPVELVVEVQAGESEHAQAALAIRRALGTRYEVQPGPPPLQSGEIWTYRFPLSMRGPP